MHVEEELVQDRDSSILHLCPIIRRRLLVSPIVIAAAVVIVAAVVEVRLEYISFQRDIPATVAGETNEANVHEGRELVAACVAQALSDSIALCCVRSNVSQYRF